MFLELSVLRASGSVACPRRPCERESSFFCTVRATTARLATNLGFPRAGLGPEERRGRPRFLNSGMCHRAWRAGPMPMLLIRFEPDHIARPDFFNRAAPLLHSADAGRDDQRLPERMRMPGGSRAGLKGNTCTARTRGIGCLKKRVDPHCSREVLRGAFSGGPRTASFNFHDEPP